MDKNFKSISESSSVKITENHNDGNYSVLETEATPALNTAKEDTSLSIVKQPKQSDRRFSAFGLWVLTLTLSFILSGILIPWLFLKGVDEVGYVFFILLMGGVSGSASLVSIFLWSLLTRKGIFGMLRFVVVLWTPSLLSQLLYAIPGSLIRVSYNDHSTSDFVLNILIYLVLPSLIGSSLALIALKCQSVVTRKGKGSYLPFPDES